MVAYNLPTSHKIILIIMAIVVLFIGAYLKSLSRTKYATSFCCLCKGPNLVPLGTSQGMAQ